MNGGQALHGRVRAVLCRAVEVYGPESPTGRVLRDQLARMDGPLRVAIAGKAKAGKSTLLNALVGEQIAPTDAGECTRVVTWYRYGRQPQVVLHPTDGAPIPLPVHREHGALRIDMRSLRPAEVDRLTVDWPASHLRDTVLIDTPGVASASPDVDRHATRFLNPADGPGEADAVVYLMRHLHSTDLRLLAAFHDDGISRDNPLHTVAVLSRADEIGVGRIDALLSARRIAERYRRDDGLRALCGTVVPVAGLLAQAGRTMRQDEFQAMCTLAAAPRTDVEAALLSVDRFTDRAAETLGVSARQRIALLDRFGLFGVRLATVLLRQGYDRSDTLAAELVRRSGVDELRAVLATRFTERRHLLKARSALLALTDVLHRTPHPGAVDLRAEVERLVAGAHEFTELRILGRLRTGTVPLARETGDEAERLLGGVGWQPHARLGLAATAGRDEQRTAAMAALHTWRTIVEHPMSDRASVEVARVVIRTCEALATAAASRTQQDSPTRRR